jgi:diguanylate cyclase (GGDEF)-like protein
METILTVDDRASDREFLAKLLGSAGYDVIHASDGVEALEIVRVRHPNLVITEALLPTMGGADFADRLHDEPEIACTPVIFYTAAYRLSEGRVLARSCRAAAILTKPAQPQDILDAVGAALGTKPRIAELSDPAFPPSFLGVKLPEYLNELTGLQRRLRRKLDQSVEQAEARRIVASDSDASAYSFQTLSLRLAALLELDFALSSERDPNEMLKLFCRCAQEMLNCRYSAVGIVAAGSSRLQNFTARGMDESVQTQLAALDAGSGLLGALVRSQKPHRTFHEASDATTLGLPAFHPPITSLLAVTIPPSSSRSLTGWLYFADKSGAERFDDEDEQFATTLAAQLALAYGNLAQYDESQQQAAKLRTEIGERQRAQDELARRVTHDQTTGLPRFALIKEHLQDALDAAETNECVILLYLGIDSFHVINETRGHSVGDDVLRVVAGRLVAACKGSGYVAHIAGDEFAIVLIDTQGVANQLNLAEALKDDIERTIKNGEQHIHLTCSIGLSYFPQNGATAKELMRQAEASLRRAKHNGRNTVCAFGNEHKQAIEDRRTLGLALDEAIRDGQLVVHYQPQVSASDWRILGFEALVRWQSPEFGLLPPCRFLGVAEDLGLLADIDNFVFESVCSQARAWLDSVNVDFCMSVNVSSVQLQRSDFVDRISATLAKWELPARHIELELTEGAMIGNVERVIGTMRALKALGVQLALDDFGTGYSSLNYLRRFPIDKLKIDQSFVLDISSDASAAGICNAIIALAHQLGMTVLAEGVETASQIHYLRSNDCDQFQGFYFGKPSPAAQALEVLKNGCAGRAPVAAIRAGLADSRKLRSGRSPRSVR